VHRQCNKYPKLQYLTLCASGVRNQQLDPLNSFLDQSPAVTLASQGKLKGWEFGEGVRVACCQTNGRYYAVQGECPRCAFDLWKGDLIANDPAFDELPRVACPTCATTYSMRTGKCGPPLKRKGLSAFVSGLTKSATTSDATKDAKVFLITVDEDGSIYCR
jgi:nitrite reductase/ring-hydroxylating ferredoxin subunit